MPTEFERSATSPSANGVTASAALIASESSQSSSQHFTEEGGVATLQTSVMEGDMSTSQTSTTSNSSSCNGGRKTSITSPDPTAYVAKARVTRPTPPPPPYNPMQFVQIKPCNLYQTAQEQLKKAEEVKKIKEIRKEEPEDWQNNLDNWKSSRRKRVEHIIDRVVEVKKLELEEHDRTRRKSKTFSEMIEDRVDRVGRPALKKLASLAVYTEDESNDLSDLGIGTSSASGKSSLSEDYDNNSVMSDNAAELDKAISNSNHKAPTDSTTREYISSPGYETSSSTAPASTPDPCEYTYEGAIQDYKQRVSRAAAASGPTSQVLSKLTITTQQQQLQQHNSKESTPERTGKESNSNSSTSSYPPRRGSKIEDRLIGFEVQSPSEECLVLGEKAKVDVPKIDISKRKEIFESQAANETKTQTSTETRITTTSSVSVPRVTLRDRFKPQEEQTADLHELPAAKKDVRRLSGDITSIKERLQSLEQQKQLVNGANGGASKPTANKLVDIPVPPLKERLSSLQNAVTKEEVIRKAPVALVDARQLEIMKIEEEKAKLTIKEEVKKQSATNSSTTTTVIQNEFSEVDRDDSGIHTADDIDVHEERLNTEHIKKEQEFKLNAAIEALAMEEKQFAEAANAVNQIEAEFEELTLGSSVALPPLASSNGPASTASSTSITNDHMEYSINEALESALEAIDKESSLPTIEGYFPQPPIVPSSNKSHDHTIITSTTLNATSMSNKVVMQKTETLTLTNKTDEEKFKKFKNHLQPQLEQKRNVVAATAMAEMKQKTEEEISKEPIYENVNAANTNAITTTTTTTSVVEISVNHMGQQKQQQHNEEDTEEEQQQQSIIPSMKCNQKPPLMQLQTDQLMNSNQTDDVSTNQNLSNQLKISQINNSFNSCPMTSNLINNNSNNNLNNNNNNNNKQMGGNSHINNNNNNHMNKSNNVDSKVVEELTNAYANQTINADAANAAATAKVAIESETLTTVPITSNNNNNNIKKPITNQLSESVAIEQIIPKKLNTNNHNSSAEDVSKAMSANHTIVDPIEPYYQVPKSSEPYYDAPKHLKPIPVYENIEIFFNGTSLSGEPSLQLQPPKEKPPPPPIESPPLFDDVDSTHTTDTYSSSENTYETLSRHQLNHHHHHQQHGDYHYPQSQDHPSPPMKRMNSTKRIKKELRNKRSSFLGIEGSSMDDDDSYLELTVAPPPDMAQLLQEERRLEKQMYLKAGLCDSSDTGESRDSGVSENHSRQSSEHYTNSSEENEPHDDNTSPLTLQTQITLEAPTNDMIYQNEGLLTVAPTPLLQTVKGNSAESWTESATVAAAATQSLSEATATANAKIMSIEEKIREQEEVLRVERELLQLEQEELKRQRENLMLRENMARRELQHGAKMLMSANRRSLQDLNGLGAAITVPTGGGNVNIESRVMPPSNGDIYQVNQMNGYAAGSALHYPQSQPNQVLQLSHQQIYANIPNLQQQYYQMDIDYRKSMSDINEFSKRMMQPPVPPSKPMRAMHINTNSAVSSNTNASNGLLHNGLAGGVIDPAQDFSSRQRHSLNSTHYGGSLVKIASGPTAAPRGGAPHIYSNYHHQSEQNLNAPSNGSSSNNGSSSQAINQSLYPGNMSRNTLHALSATPKPKFTDGWVQVQQRKSYDSNLANDPAWMSAYQQKRKSMPDAYHAHSTSNHWLVQEAEQRRLVEQQKRRVQSSSNTPTHVANKLTNGGGATLMSSSSSSSSNGKPLPDSIIQTLTERVQSKGIGERKRNNLDKSPLHAASQYHQYNKTTTTQMQTGQIPQQQQQSAANSSSSASSNLVTTHRHTTMTSSTSSNGQLSNTSNSATQDKVLSVSGKKKCSHCGDELDMGCTSDKCRHTHRELKYIVWV
ncbi:FK506-binding protein 5 isoform X5 [Stomoxys calcitrans]|uniref:FK506-binding protein 5 isoform X5 n=1 Tax=Stomoxys calcitrans TaxID=35570 RepID=UPI0027E27423|nr:FK506-binding protein 5 isoform X5 [Stomoxys calcitrans]